MDFLSIIYMQQSIDMLKLLLPIILYWMGLT